MLRLNKVTVNEEKVIYNWLIFGSLILYTVQCIREYLVISCIEIQSNECNDLKKEHINIVGMGS